MVSRLLKKRRSWAVVGLAIVLVAAPACGDDDDGSDASGGTTDTTSGSVEDQLRTTLDCDVTLTPEEVANYESPTPDEDYDITFMQVSLAGYYYQAIKAGAEELAPAGVNVTTVAAEGYVSPEQQLSQLEDAIQGGTDAIVMAPSDIQGSVPVVERASEEDLPVVNVSTEVASDDVWMVMQDDYIMGQMLADRVAEVLGEEGGAGVLIAGPANATWSRKRAIGFADQVEAEHPNIEIVAAPTQLVDPAEGLASFEDAVQANPDIDWIASVHYYILQPESVPETYRGSVPYVSMGLEPDSIAALQNGTLDSVFGIQPIAMGQIGVGTAIDVLNGGDPPRVTCVPAVLFTADDIGSDIANAELAPADR